MKPITATKMLSVFFGAVLLLMAGPSQPTVAQNPSPTPQAAPTQEFLLVTVVSVKPEMMAEFQNFLKNTTNPALKKGGLKWREVWQNTGAAGDAFEYVLVSPVEKLADFDGPSPVEKGLGPQGFPAWQVKANSLVNSVRRFIIRTRPDLSFMTQGAGTPKLAVITFLHLAPNRNTDFENYLKNDFVPVMKQAGVTYVVSQVIFGGDANQYITLTMRDSFADLDKGPVLVQALGAEGAQKLMQKLPTGTVVQTERSITRYVPDLSIRTTAP